MTENLVERIKDNRVLMSQNYQSDSCPWKFHVLKAAYLPSKLQSLLDGQMFVLTPHFRSLHV